MTFRKVYRELWPTSEWPVAQSISFSSMLIDATGEKAAWLGRVTWETDGVLQKNVSRVWFRFGTVTKAGGSGLTVSLQDVSTSNGPPIQPDETQDQTVSIANGDAGFASNTNYRTGAFSAVRAVTKGDPLAVVVEYDGGGRLGSDAVNFQNLNSYGGNVGSRPLQGGANLKTGGTWTIEARIPLIVLEFDDGSFGTFEGAYPFVSGDATSFNSGSTPDERGAEFTVDEAIQVDAFWAALTLSGASSDFDMVLYEGTTSIATCSVDANTINSTSDVQVEAELPLASPVTLTPGNTYRLMLKPTTANNVALYSLDVADAGHLKCVGNSGNWLFTSRTDGGAFAAVTTTRRPMMGLRICGRAARISDLVNSDGLVQ